MLLFVFEASIIPSSVQDYNILFVLFLLDVGAMAHIVNFRSSRIVLLSAEDVGLYFFEE